MISNSDLPNSAIPIPVVKLTPSGEFVAEYPSVRAAALANGLQDSRPITNCCRGNNHVKTVGGYHFLYKSDYDPAKDNRVTIASSSLAVAQLDLNGNVINRFPSLSAAARFLNVKNATPLKKCCLGLHDTYHGFRWKFISQE